VQFAKSCSRSIVLAVAAAPLAPLVGSQLAAMPSNRRRRCHKTGQIQAPGVTRRLESGRPRCCLGEPLSPLVLSHFQLACRSQRHRCLRLPQLAPSSLSPLLVAMRSRRHFLSMRHFPHWPRRTITIGPFSCGGHRGCRVGERPQRWH
jgi:hypothetical protein